MSNHEAAGESQAPAAPDLSGAPKLEKKTNVKASKVVEEVKEHMDDSDYKKIKAMKHPLMVVATEKGFYGNYRLNPGDVFQIKSGADFSRNWMEIKN